MDPITHNLPDQIALLDATGTILETNGRWQQEQPDSIGLNFLQVYDRIVDTPDTKPVRCAIQKISSKEQSEFSCGTSMKGQPYAMQMAMVQGDDKVAIMVSFRDQNGVDSQNLQQQIDLLTETNIALNTLLKSREQDMATLEGAIATNVKQLIMPYVERLQKEELAPQHQTLLTIIKDYLDNLVSPFLHRMSTISQQLTPQELKVASLIRQGRSSKEIGKALGLTVNGVGFHRKSIRTKLGLTGSGKNLRSQLMALR
jgi:DNA-binding CsgD family transcriptional regulator